MEDTTTTDSNVSRLPAMMKYDNAVVSFADARLQYKASILKYRNLIRERELSNLKKLTYADVDQFVPSFEKSTPQLFEQIDRRKQFIEDLKSPEDFARMKQCLHDELNMISEILQRLKPRKEQSN